MNHHFWGEFRNGNPEGKGMIRRKDGSIFEGEWSGGEEVPGHCRVTFLNGDVFEGECFGGHFTEGTKTLCLFFINLF